MCSIVDDYLVVLRHMVYCLYSEIIFSVLYLELVML